MRAWLAGIMFAATATCRAASLEEAYAGQGQLLVTQFVSAPFPHPARADGYTYKGKSYPAKEHYIDSTVAIFIPKSFRETGSVDLVIHFHGWFNTVGGTLAGFQLIEQLVASGKNAVLVVPEGPHNAPDSFGGKLEDPEGFKRFLTEITATLKQRHIFKNDFQLGKIILSGHSGGYRVISAILDRGGMTSSIKEVWLFDALYAEADKFLTWFDHEHGRLIDIFTDNGGTKDDSEALMGALKVRGTPFVSIEETAISPELLRTNNLLFIHTDLGHNDVVAKRQQFAQYLRASCLDPMKP